MTNLSLDRFTEAYLECALWSSNDESDESGGQPLDLNYSIYDLHDSAIEQAVADCQDFQTSNRADIEAAGLTDTRAGFCFWLNRNGHGSGFWDEKFETPEQKAALERLNQASENFGTVDLYVGDDGKVYAA